MTRSFQLLLSCRHPQTRRQWLGWLDLARSSSCSLGSKCVSMEHADVSVTLTIERAFFWRSDPHTLCLTALESSPSNRPLRPLSGVGRRGRPLPLGPGDRLGVARRIGYLRALLSRVGCKVNITNAVGTAAELLGDV